MFNNPFESFHDMVAEAKEEREQLDRLLTISTPRERLLVAAVAVFLLILSAWLFFGNIARSIAFNGILVEQGETLPEGSRHVQALAWIQSSAAPSIEAGMPVMVELGTKDTGASTLGGAVKAVFAIPFPEEMSAFPPAASVSLYRVDIALEEGLDADHLSSRASRECRLVIVLGRQAPVELFLTKRL